MVCALGIQPRVKSLRSSYPGLKLLCGMTGVTLHGVVSPDVHGIASEIVFVLRPSECPRQSAAPDTNARSCVAIARPNFFWSFVPAKQNSYADRLTILRNQLYHDFQARIKIPLGPSSPWLPEAASCPGHKCTLVGYGHRPPKVPLLVRPCHATFLR